ncbi:MAG: cation-transporting P-type ATPase, partial [Aquificota bacterium]
MHSKTHEEVLRELGSSYEGLGREEVKNRLKAHGYNTLEEEQESKLRVFVRQFTSPFVVILMLAGLLALAFGELKDAAVVYGILLINGLIGFYQEIKAIASIKALKSLTAPTVKVIREGKQEEVKVEELVPGDIVLLAEGDVVPADIRLIESAGLLVDEALLTGESVPVEKEAQRVLPEDTPLHDRVNCLYKGTHVVRGKALGVVFATGKNTELGKIAQKVLEKSPESPLTKALGSFGKKWIATLIVVLSSLVLYAVFVQGRNPKEVVFFGIAQLVSAVPEGLPIVVTIALVVGAIRLSRQKVLVKYLPAVETLGSATYICSDKTGTITVGRLTVENYIAYNKTKLFYCSALCNDADAQKGDPLEVALLEWLERERVNWQAIRDAYERLWEHPFDTKRRLMAVVVKEGQGYSFYVKGAYESLKKMCINPPQEAERHHDELAEKGLRVLAFGYARLEHIPESVDEVSIELVGLVGFL